MLLIIAFGILGLIGYLFLMRNSNRKIHALFQNIPGRIGVLGKSGKILFLKTDIDDPPETAAIRKPSDHPAIANSGIAEAAKRVFETGTPVSFEYEYGSTHRSVTIAAPQRIFGEEAVVWISHDASPLRNARREAESNAGKFNETLKLWNLVTDNIPVMIVLKNPADDFRYIMTNKAFEQFVELPRAEIIGRNDHQILLDAGTAEHFRACDKNVMEQDAPAKFFDDIMRKDGRMAHLSSIRMPFRGADGTPLLLGVIVDITELDQLVKDLQALNSNLETLIRTDDFDLAFRRVLESACTHMSASCATLLRFSEPEPPGILSRYPEQFPHSVALERAVSEECKNALGEKETVTLTSYRNHDAECAEFVKEQNIRAIYANRIEAGSQPWGALVLTYTEDKSHFSEQKTRISHAFAHLIELILERKQIQRKMVEALEQARAADKAKSFFIASVSHEIRTPLNSVIGFAELLRDGYVQPAQQKDYLNNIASSGNALLQLINDVLDLSKLEAGKMQLIPEPTDFLSLSHEVMRVFSQRAMKHNLLTVVNVPPLPELELDKLRIRQILFNLIGNAIKFTLSGSVTLQAEFCPNGDGTGKFSFKVIDTGIGISPADQAKLLEPFVQLSQLRDSDSRNNGTGLGLSISKRLVESMGGKLLLESRPGHGSSFEVQLPSVAVSPERRTRPDADSRPAARRRLPSRLSVLLVDDVEMNLKVLAAMCAKIGIGQIIQASSGKAALEKIEQHNIDLVLTDVWMPKMNGAELARKLHADPRFAGLPVFAVTADIEMKNHFQQKDFSGTILKPVTLEKLKQIFDSFQTDESEGEELP